MKGRYLTFDDRKRFESLYNRGTSLKVIAKALGINLSTAYRELKRGENGTFSEYWKKNYSAKIAQANFIVSVSNRGFRKKGTER